MLFNFAFVRCGFIPICASLVMASGLMASTARVDSCSTCYSSASFLYHAEQSSLGALPGFEGTEFVYISNFYTGETRFFRVERWVDNDFDPYGAPPIETLSRRTWDPRVGGYFRAEAFEMPGNPQEIAEIDEGIEAASSFFQFVPSGFSAGDLPDIDIDSAVSLVGPPDSPASFNRGALENALENYLHSNWQSMRVGVSDMALRFLNGFVGEGAMQALSALIITFPDGTSIEVEIEKILASFQANGDVVFQSKVLPESAQGPGLLAVPQYPGHFNGFNYSGNPDTLSELVLLAQLHDIPVVDAGSGDGGECSMSCEVEGDALACEASCSPN